MTDKIRGILGSTVLHILIIVLLVLFGFTTQLPLPGEQGIIINFGDSEDGMGLTEPRKTIEQETAPIQEVIQEEDETPITQDFEEAPSLPEKKPIPEPKPEKPKEPKPEKPREVDNRILFPGQKADGGSSGEGETGKDGNQGALEGDPNSTNREGGTTSGGEGVSYSVGDRAHLSLPKPIYLKQKSGVVVVRVTVDRSGNVTSVSGGYKGSTTYDTDLVSAAEKAARSARFNVNLDAPAFQEGTITYVFKLQQ
ncbi:MAG: TonB family protein [Bacteroidales bacterium]|jgi:TonB family protein|nr:TonB family protein [Bacteroidales bacterium]MDD4383724.1 TonB family protein [Bacteroidales bacterium]MDY0196255.1 TonB family protein [Tenuifilaceae bacterium]